MALTVYAENMGLFHKGSGGKGIAPIDVCLSPPPPPTGPIPIPYVNVLKASNLAKGSKTVRVDKKPTALEDASHVSTSTGDEMGTQGGSVITAKTKGKGYFQLWSFTVQIEGKGVCRHGDPMGQNCASMPPSCVNMAALTKRGSPPPDNEECAEPYDNSKRVEATPAQRESVQGKNCWQCGETPAEVVKRARREIKRRKGTGKPIKALQEIVNKAERKPNVRGRNPMNADHQVPQKIEWENGGCNLEDGEFKKWAQEKSTVMPQCHFCSNSQGGALGDMTPKQIRALTKRANEPDLANLRNIDAQLPFSPPNHKALLVERGKILAKFKF